VYVAGDVRFRHPAAVAATEIRRIASQCLIGGYEAPNAPSQDVPPSLYYASDGADFAPLGMQLLCNYRPTSYRLINVSSCSAGNVSA
jgi:hypothetical protein